jgi:DNA polymerase III epsilon subunit-like protein
MPPWADRPVRTASLAFFDLETTGLRPDRGGRICEIAVVDQDGVQLDWSSSDASPPDAALRRQLLMLVERLQSGIVVGHHLPFDLRFLTYEAERLGLGGLDVRFADTLGLARRVLAGRDDYRLGALAHTFDGPPDAALHTAVGDALATRSLFWTLVEEDGLETLADVGVKRLSWNAR